MQEATFKTKLKVKSKKIHEGLKQLSGSFRFVYNTAMDYQWDKMVWNANCYADQVSTIAYLQECFMKDRKKHAGTFISTVDRSLANKAITSSYLYFSNWYRHRMQSYRKKSWSLLPKYMARKTEGMHFSLSGVKVFYDHIKVTNLGKIGLYEKGYIPQGQRISNVSFTHDGKDWWISVRISYPNEKKDISDLKGSLYVDFDLDGTLHTSVGSFQSVRNLPSFKKQTQKHKSLSRKLGRQKKANMTVSRSGKAVIRTSRNMLKTRKALLRVSSKLVRIKCDYFRKITSELARTKPLEICLLAKNAAKAVKQGYLTRASREASTRHFASILLRKMQTQGTNVNTFMDYNEIAKALGSGVCGEIS